MWKTVRTGLLALVTLWYVGLALAAVVVLLFVLVGAQTPAPPTPHGVYEPYQNRR